MSMMLRPTLPRIGYSLRSFRRSLHSVPPLVHEYRTGGVPEFLSPEGFNIAWTQYQSMMVDKLNALTAGSDYENKSPKDVLLKYAREPDKAAIFNYASMAHNNHFFFSCLSPQPTVISPQLKQGLEASFSSIETLQRQFVLTASVMFGPGFVWLMKSKDEKFSLLTTYLAGSPYPGAHYRKQTVDFNTETNATGAQGISGAIREKWAGQAVNTVGAHGRYSDKEIAPGGIDISPVLCLNTWEHVYLRDYGVGASGQGGKTVFASNWWHRIDWNVVHENAYGRKPTMFG